MEGPVGSGARNSGTEGPGAAGRSGKARVVWSGGRAAPEVEVQEEHQEFDWAAARREVRGEEVELARAPEAITLSLEERRVYEQVVGLLRDSLGQGVEPAVVAEVLGVLQCPAYSVVRLCGVVGAEGRVKGLAATLVSGLQAMVQEAAMEAASLETRDAAFLRFVHQPPAVARAAWAALGLVEGRARYSLAVFDLARRGEFKVACDAAVALQLFDWYSVHVFCLPLLLLDKPAPMEAYLATSPGACTQFISVLDLLHAEGAPAVARLQAQYPAVKPLGAFKLSGKPVDKMIKRYAELFHLPPALYPRTLARRAASDLRYWVKQFYGGGEHALTRTNWRELVERKVAGVAELQHLLVALLEARDPGEAHHWNSRLGLGYSTSPGAEAELTWPHVEQEGGVEYHALVLPASSLVLVDTEELFLAFLEGVEGEQVVGVDLEYMTLCQEQRVSLLQVATATQVFLLDFELLPAVVDPAVLARLASLFTSPLVVKVGFGLAGDIRLLGRSGVPGLEGLSERSQAVINLDRARARLGSLLGLAATQERGLSGLVLQVLGRRLSKLDQISDW